MNTLPHLLTIWSAYAAGALVASVWQGVLLTAGVAVCLRLLPGLSAARRSVLWLATLLAVVLLHLSPGIGHHAAPAASHNESLRLSAAWALIIAAAWCLLSLYRSVQLVWSAVRLGRIAARSTPVAPDAVCAALLRQGQRPVALCVSDDVDRPSVIGFRSPRILLPPALLAELSASELEHVILHEMEHLRRGDDWINLLQKIVLAAFPLHPVLLWIEHQLCVERELACDDGVLRQTLARKAYAVCLTRLAEHSMLRRGALLALGAWERQSELSRRVYRILRQPPAVPGTGQARWVSALLGVVLFAGAGELAHSPELVQFATAGQGVQQAALAPEQTMPAGPARVVLTSAAMPENRQPGPARPARAVMVRTVAHKPATVRTVAARPRVAPLPPLVLTSWKQTQMPGTIVLAVREQIPPSYAAVPLGNGWLIIQL